MAVKNIAVILAGGKGERFATSVPKQFAKVAGKTIIEHTINCFEQHEQIDEIAIVMNSTYIDKLEGIILKNNWSKVKKVLAGGKERYDSSLAAIHAYEQEGNVNLIFHDAVRPLVDEQIITETIEALEQYTAVDVAIPATDTIIQINTEERIIERIPDRSKLYQGQTPQGFKLETIAEAYRLALQDSNFKTTDDCGVVRKYLPDEKIYVVNGSKKNMKLTHMEDLYFIDKLYQLNSIRQNAYVPYEELNGKVLVVFGGNAGIGKEICDIAESHGAKVYAFSRRVTNTDISNLEQVQAAFDKVMQQESKIDYVVVSAAVLRKEAFHTMEIEDIDSMIDINYKGMIYVSKCAYPYLKESKGQLLHFTSSSYTLGRPFYSLYSSSKAAVVNFVQALSQEWSEVGIRVNCINPERTLTEMRVKNFGKEDPSTLLTAQEVAEASIAILLSKYSGQVIDVRIKK